MRRTFAALLVAGGFAIKDLRQELGGSREPDGG
jgi:hypothetical protein